jgi:hypothetical protein
MRRCWPRGRVILIALVLVGAGALSGCYYDPYSGYWYTYPPYPYPWAYPYAYRYPYPYQPPPNPAPGYSQPETPGYTPPGTPTYPPPGTAAPSNEPVQRAPLPPPPS